MARDSVNDLGVFLAIAREGSFTRAAAKLGVSPSALSHAVRLLEERLGIRLLTRTTRRVSLTEAGEKLLKSIQPHFDGIENALGQLAALRDKPAGLVRITAGEHAVNSILWPAIRRLLPDYPDIKFEITSENALTDIVWEFEKDGREVKVRVDGPLAFNTSEMALRAAVAGAGLGHVLEDHAMEDIKAGRLIPVLEDWSPPFAGYHLYYPSRRQMSPAFAVLVEALRYRGP